MVNGLITLSGTGRNCSSAPEVRAAYLEGGRQLRMSGLWTFYSTEITASDRCS